MAEIVLEAQEWQFVFLYRKLSEEKKQEALNFLSPFRGIQIVTVRNNFFSIVFLLIKLFLPLISFDQTFLS